MTLDILAWLFLLAVFGACALALAVIPKPPPAAEDVRALLRARN